MAEKGARQKGSDHWQACLAFTLGLQGKTELAGRHRLAVQNAAETGLVEVLCCLADALQSASETTGDKRPEVARERLSQCRKLFSNRRLYHHRSYAKCYRAALRVLREEVPGAVRWRDWMALGLLEIRARTWHLGGRFIG
jgi:hypothetical protein